MNCKNCHNTLRDTQKFCDECGAKVIYNRLKPKIIAQQINEQFISIDNKFLLTFIDLFKTPETVIVGYIDGTRKKYIDVLQYFAIALTLAGIQVFLINTFFKDALNFNADFVHGLGNLPENQRHPMADFNSDFFTKYQGLIYILGVPVSALATWLVYFMFENKRFNFTEHLVINLYYSAQIIILTAFFSILFLVTGINYLIVSTILGLPTFIYLAYVLKKIFKEDFWNTFAKFLVVMFLYFIIYFVIIIVVFAVLFISGYLNI
ncbi:DUF3667 domain-containing protein [Winogradskyella sediminis]|uniref:Zinc-ribbon domain-containing protein n=1 Tax=Winogradskyella sediminis TaxID=1382466 RepID=A0A1H1P8U4_9FLAO|nr:DUF3667 domain-containing protein [Winogradskyella sediminis]SDS07405.1 Protein of unknown function [Winogradskyella sediminis]